MLKSLRRCVFSWCAVTILCLISDSLLASILAMCAALSFHAFAIELENAEALKDFE